MKTQTVFRNASLVSVVNGSIVVKDSTGREHTFVNASVVSVNNGTIIIETEWKPKKGELVKITGQCIDAYSIIDNINDHCIHVFGWKKIGYNTHCFKKDIWLRGSQTNISPVTPEEQKEFDDFCKSQGKIWNKETLQWEEYKWKPKNGECYYVIYGNGEIDHLYYQKSEFQDKYIDLGNCFQTKEQAKSAAEKVKELLKSL